MSERDRQRSRFDFAFLPSGPVQETIDLVRLGEELGYRCAWIADERFHRDPFALLALCAQATREIGLGLGVTSPYTRLPVQIARAAATVDEVAGGRLRLGLGTANVDNVLRPLGIELRRPVERLGDAIGVLRRLLAGETVHLEGSHDTLRGVKLDFQPLRADIPIYLGTRGAATLELAGQMADGVLATVFNGDGPRYVLEHLQKGAQRAGRNLESVDVVAWQTIQVTADPAGAIAQWKPWFARSIKAGPREAFTRIGVREEVIDAVIAALERGDLREAVERVTDEAVQCQMVIGDLDYVSARLENNFEQGATTVSLLLLGPTQAVRDTLVEFARSVMPRF